MPEETIDPGLLEQTKNQIRKLVAEIADLAESDIQPAEFYVEFLNRSVAAVAATGGAFWMMDGRGGLRLQYQVEFCLTGSDGRPRQDRSLTMHCWAACSRRRRRRSFRPSAVIEGVPQAFNPTEYALIIAPLIVDKQVVGLLEILMDPTRRAAQQKSTLRFVSDLCDLAGTYLKNRQMRQMMSQQRLWNQLEGFTHQIHGSLDLKETAYAVVNDGKRLVGCDRLSVALKIAGRTLVEAVSGQEVVEQRSNLVRELTRLCKVVIRSGEDLVYTGNTDGFAPDIRDAVEMYVDESGSKVVVVTMLHKPETRGGRREQQGKGPVRLPGRRADRRRTGTDGHACPNRGRFPARLDGALELPGTPQDLPQTGLQGDGLSLADVPRPDAGQDRRCGGAGLASWRDGIRAMHLDDRGPRLAFARGTPQGLRPGPRHRRRSPHRSRRSSQEGRYSRQAREQGAPERAEGVDRPNAQGRESAAILELQLQKATLGQDRARTSISSRPRWPRPSSPPRAPASGSRSSTSRSNR